MKPPTIPELVLMRLGLPDDAARWYAAELRRRPLTTLRGIASDVLHAALERRHQ